MLINQRKTKGLLVLKLTMKLRKEGREGDSDPRNREINKREYVLKLERKIHELEVENQRLQNLIVRYKSEDWEKTDAESFSYLQEINNARVSTLNVKNFLEYLLSQKSIFIIFQIHQSHIFKSIHNLLC